MAMAEEYRPGAEVSLTPAELKASQQRALAAEAEGAKPVPTGMTSPGIVQVPAGMHPDHDEPVVFTRGELLPEWAARALLEQQPQLDQGVYKLAPVGRRKPPREVT
jgi:hypothetical protein